MEEVKNSSLKLRPKKYSKNTSSDANSISIVEQILDKERAFPHLFKIDKTPNYDGYIELIKDEFPIGKLEVQVKTLKNNYTNPSYNIDLSTLSYAKDCQLPFLLIAVDQNGKKAFWIELKRNLASDLINKALNKNVKQKSISVKFEEQNEISNDFTYELWNGIVEQHKLLLNESIELGQKHDELKTELINLKSQFIQSDKDINEYYVQFHIFLDKLNELFKNEFNVVKILFRGDFWKFGIVTFGPITDSCLTYSLIAIDWNQNSKQIFRFYDNKNIFEFVANFPSYTSFSNSNPLLKDPIAHAYERIWRYLELTLERKLIQSKSKFVQYEFLFSIRDSQFRNLADSETGELNLILLKFKIEEFLKIIPESQIILMKQYPSMENNLYKALDYIQNIRMDGKELIKRLSYSKVDYNKLTDKILKTGKFPLAGKRLLFNYWNSVLNGYEDIIAEIFPLLKHELSHKNYFNTIIIVPHVIKSKISNDMYLNFGKIDVFKLRNKNSSKMKILIELELGKIEYNTLITKYRNIEFETYSWEDANLSILGGSLPVEASIFMILKQNLEMYIKDKSGGN